MRRPIMLAACLMLAACSPEQDAKVTATLNDSATVSVTIIGDVDDPEALQAYLSGLAKSEPFRAVAASSVDGGPAHPRLTFVYLTDRCGSGGCSLHILEKGEEGLRELSRITITWAPVRMLESQTSGMPDIAVKVCGGGIIECYEARLPFDGSTYATNPTVLPAERVQGEITGQVVIPEEDVTAAFRLNAPSPA